MQVHYLEIVTEEVDCTCDYYSSLHNVTFADYNPSLGNARTAPLSNGGVIAVRAPMHESEGSLIRPYLLVENIEEALVNATKTGADIAHPPMEIPGHGTFAIIIQGDNQHGLWQL
jgi:uncharacterized protein